jgi:hypothetical protein
MLADTVVIKRFGNESYGFGVNNSLVDTTSYAFGLNNYNINGLGFAFGLNNYNINGLGFAFGKENYNIEINSCAFGQTNNFVSEGSYTLGMLNQRINSESFAIGEGNININAFSYSFGEQNDTIDNYSYAFGKGLKKLNDSIFVIGKYNINVSDSTDKRAFVFAYGGGNATRKNYAEILKNGKLYLNYGGIHTNGVSKLRTDTLFIDSTNTTLTAAFTQWVYIKTGAENDTITFPVATKGLAGVEITITKDNAGVGACVINYESSEAILTAIDDYAILRCNGYRWILYGNKLTP